MSELARYADFSYDYPGGGGGALRHLSLHLDDGLNLVTGRSGSGKTTLLRTLNGLVPHFHGGTASGNATVLGRDLRTTTPRQLARQVALVFQEPEAQFVLATVRREVAFGPENLGLPAPEIRDRVDAALEAMGISELAGRRISTLSGGQRQRVALAAALSMAPQLLVLDEPTSQLDADGAEALRSECERLARGGVSVVVAEHRPWRVASAGARWLELCDGSLVSIEETGTAPTQPARRRPRPAGSEAWELAGAAVGHDQPVLEGVDLSCAKGQVLCLTGPNGSGKTSLLRTAAGLLRPLAGSVSRGPGRSAYLPQEPGAVLHMPTLREEVGQTIRWLRLGCSPRPILEQFGLVDLAESDPHDLSTGQRQRAALAAVLVGEPEMVFLDEPTRGADSESRRRLVEAIDRLAAAGAAVLVATSDAEFARQVGDTVHELVDGRLRQLAEVAA
jgi:energy-coupling factor transport system ATP-binding protein